MNAEDDDTVEMERSEIEIHLIKKIIKRIDDLQNGVTNSRLAQIIDGCFELGELIGTPREEMFDILKQKEKPQNSES